MQGYKASVTTAGALFLFLETEVKVQTCRKWWNVTLCTKIVTEILKSICKNVYFCRFQYCLFRNHVVGVIYTFTKKPGNNESWRGGRTIE